MVLRKSFRGFCCSSSPSPLSWIVGGVLPPPGSMSPFGAVGHLSLCHLFKIFTWSPKERHGPGHHLRGRWAQPGAQLLFDPLNMESSRGGLHTLACLLHCVCGACGGHPEGSSGWTWGWVHGPSNTPGRPYRPSASQGSSSSTGSDWHCAAALPGQLKNYPTRLLFQALRMVGNPPVEKRCKTNSVYKGAPVCWKHLLFP